MAQQQHHAFRNARSPPSAAPASHPLPPLPPGQASEPVVHFHPASFYDLRSQFTGTERSLAILKSLLAKVKLDGDCYSVTRAARFGPGGRNAFFSRARYWHPVKAQVDAYLKRHPHARGKIAVWEEKVKWECRDGVSFNEADWDGTGKDGRKERSQGSELNSMADEVFLLALGYHFGTKFWGAEVVEQYAWRACQLLWCFFGDETTWMLPEVYWGQVKLNYPLSNPLSPVLSSSHFQYIPGTQPKRHKYRPEGFLHIRRLILVSQVVPLLPPPPHPYSPHGFMHPWLDRHVNFLLHSEVGIDAKKRKNNISTYYLTMLTTHLITFNRADHALALIFEHFLPAPQYPLGISSKIDPQTGRLIQEFPRPGNSFHYTAFELNALVFLADLVDSVRKYNNHPTSLWEVETHALKRAVDFGIEHFFSKERTDNAAKVDLRHLVFVVKVVARQYGREQYVWLIGKERERGMEKGEKLLKGWTERGQLRWSLKEGE